MKPTLIFVMLIAACGPPQGMAQRWTIWHWNVAGAAMHDGSTTSGMVDRAVASIVNRGADFATFNELCRTQYDAIVAGLRAAGWPYDLENFARFDPNVTAPADGSSHCGVQNVPPPNPLFSSLRGQQGNAVFSKRPLGASTSRTLRYAGETTWGGAPEQRSLFCAPLAALPMVRICTVHLTTVDEMKSTQLNQVRDYLASVGGTPIVTGDFNMQPYYARMNRIYSSSVWSTANPDNYGVYRELDDRDSRYPRGTGELTTIVGTKLDYIFVRESRIAPGTTYDFDAMTIPHDCAPSKKNAPLCSDHNAIVGHVTLSY